MNRRRNHHITAVCTNIHIGQNAGAVWNADAGVFEEELPTFAGAGAWNGSKIIVTKQGLEFFLCIFAIEVNHNAIGYGSRYKPNVCVREGFEPMLDGRFRRRLYLVRPPPNQRALILWLY